jgi:uncharacterized protein (TIGR02271 family)
MSDSESVRTLELREEQIEVGKREVVQGRVVVRTQVEERDEIIEAALRRENVSVERVARDVPVEMAPAVREENGVLIVPVLEERLVVRTQLFLKEELHITKTSRIENVSRAVRLKSEHAHVTREQGPASDPLQPEEGNRS